MPLGQPECMLYKRESERERTKKKMKTEKQASCDPITYKKTAIHSHVGVLETEPKPQAHGKCSTAKAIVPD